MFCFPYYLNKIININNVVHKSLVKMLFSNYDRVETVLEYEMETMVEVLRKGLYDKIPELGIKEPVMNMNQLRMFEGGKMLVDGKSLAEFKVKQYDDHPTAITISIRPVSVPPSIVKEKEEPTPSGCCIIS